MLPIVFWSCPVATCRHFSNFLGKPAPLFRIGRKLKVDWSKVFSSTENPSPRCPPHCWSIASILPCHESRRSISSMVSYWGGWKQASVHFFLIPSNFWGFLYRLFWTASHCKPQECHTILHRQLFVLYRLLNCIQERDIFSIVQIRSTKSKKGHRRHPFSKQTNR